MSPKARADRRSQVPSVDALLRSAPGRRATARFGRALVKQALKETLEDVRAGASGGGELPSEREILARALGEAARTYYGIREVINATGVILHTGLGRAPLPSAAAQSAAAVAGGYADLAIER